jgi:hypothetical protein
MGEVAVDADRKHLNAEFLEFWVFDGNCRQFRRSDAGKVGGVKAEHHPLPAVIGKGYLLGSTLVVCLQTEIRRFFTYMYCHLSLPPFILRDLIVAPVGGLFQQYPTPVSYCLPLSLRGAPRRGNLYLMLYCHYRFLLSFPRKWESIPHPLRSF